jgi:DNA-binding CsgD family transcriptional regulator
LWYRAPKKTQKLEVSSRNPVSTLAALHLDISELDRAATSAEGIQHESTGGDVTIAASDSGFLLLDPTLNPVASNAEAAQILSFPNIPEKIKRLNVFLADKVRSSLLDHQSKESLNFVKEFRSGKRRYICRAFRLQCHDNGARLAVVVLLERYSSGATALSEVSKQFDLTEREQETVELLLQGLTSKEIATRMGISPNTVKAFLRLVMVKMGVSTRSGILGRIVRP